jgi:predicted secreted hydrolase
MRSPTFLAVFLFLISTARAADPAWHTATPGWQYAWPRDHTSHPEFKTEWWYFTGALHTADGRRFGYELTFFRQGLRPPGSLPVRSRFVTNDLKLAHFALTDVKAQRFTSWQHLTRGAFAEAGYGDGTTEPRLAWNGDWSVTLAKDGSFDIKAREAGRALTLHLDPTKPMIPHGENGVSRKATEAGHASHYYSATRLRTRGTIALDGQSLSGEGESWFDHEWATNQLAPGQSGWDWFSLQFADGTELMLYQLRRRDGTIDAASSGTWVAADGTARHLRHEDLKLTPTQWWTSQATRGKYPIGWHIEIPSLSLAADITTPVESQELTLPPVIYWEGLIDTTATRAGHKVTGHGYLELTGYAGEFTALTGGLK